MENQIPKIYESINKIQAALAKTGISKERKNKEQGYAFRGIDDVYGALAPLLAENHVCIMPRVTERDFRERTTSRGTVLFYVTVRAEFDFVSAIDGSKHTCVTYGEAMDTADKATNKAMSAAYKYACLQTFCIPTEGDNDADATTHTVAPQSEPETPKRAGPDDWLTTNAFEGIAARTDNISDLQRILNEQRDNPHLRELAEIATARKREIMDNLQMQGV